MSLATGLIDTSLACKHLSVVVTHRINGERPEESVLRGNCSRCGEPVIRTASSFPERETGWTIDTNRQSQPEATWLDREKARIAKAHADFGERLGYDWVRLAPTIYVRFADICGLKTNEHKQVCVAGEWMPCGDAAFVEIADRIAGERQKNEARDQALAEMDVT